MTDVYFDIMNSCFKYGAGCNRDMAAHLGGLGGVFTHRFSPSGLVASEQVSTVLLF